MAKLSKINDGLFLKWIPKVLERFRHVEAFTWSNPFSTLPKWQKFF